MHQPIKPGCALPRQTAGSTAKRSRARTIRRHLGQAGAKQGPGGSGYWLPNGPLAQVLQKPELCLRASDDPAHAGHCQSDGSKLCETLSCIKPLVCPSGQTRQTLLLSRRGEEGSLSLLLHPAVAPNQRVGRAVVREARPRLL